MRFLSGRENLSVAVIGFGYVGSCLAATLADRGFDVLAVDTDPRLPEELARGHCRFQEEGLPKLVFDGLASGKLRVSTDPSGLASADVVLVSVGTPVLEDGSLADEQLRAACAELGRHLRKGQLIVLKSTVPPGTTRDVVLPLLEQESGLIGQVDFGLAYTPERLAEGTALRELRTFPIVVGGLGAESAAAAAEFWHGALGVEVIGHDSLESAEIVKLASNWWIDVNIALANELAKFCSLYDVDVLDVISATNTIPKGAGNVNVLLPSVGVGGSCLTKDPWMVWRAADRRGVDIRTAVTGREVNSGMPEYTAQVIVDELVRLGKDPATAKVAVLGLAFKNNTGDLRATPTQGVAETLAKAGAEVRLFDPLVDPERVEQMYGIGLSPSVDDAVEGVDCIAVLALHREFEGIDFAQLPVAGGCLVLDGRAYYSKEKIAELRALGYAYRGIGR